MIVENTSQKAIRVGHREPLRGRTLPPVQIEAGEVAFVTDAAVKELWSKAKPQIEAKGLGVVDVA